jgi:hypothetical protein
MTRAGARGVPRFDDQGAVAARAVAKWLRLAAAPTFAVMALLTVVFDSGLSNALCSAAGGSGLSGMAPMYFLMSVFHSAPWLKRFGASMPPHEFGEKRG